MEPIAQNEVERHATDADEQVEAGETSPILPRHDGDPSVPGRAGLSAEEQGHESHMVLMFGMTPSMIVKQVVLLVACVVLMTFVVQAVYNPVVKEGELNKTSPLRSKALRNSQYRLSFLVVGDWGRDGAFGQQETADAMAKVIHDKYVDPTLVISTGDNFYEHGVQTAKDDQWRTSFEDVYHHEELTRLPWYISVGNHDHYGNALAQVEYAKTSKRWMLPATYYSFVRSLERVEGTTSRYSTAAVDGERPSRKNETVLFIVLDSSLYMEDEEGDDSRRRLGSDAPRKQLQWLADLLDDDTQPRRVIVILHHNMYSTSATHHLGVREQREHIEPVLLRHRHRVVAILSGHEHLIMHMQPYGREGIWTGAAANTSEQDSTDRMLYNNGTVDYFVSGAGSHLISLDPPEKGTEAHWASCCGVLSLLGRKTYEPKSLWSKSQNAFFAFTITEDMFQAVAYNEQAKQMYVYEKPLEPISGE